MKRYVAEPGSGWIRQTTDAAAGHYLFTDVLSGPEMIAAIVRRGRGGQLRRSAVTRAVSEIRFDWQYRYAIVDVDRQVVSRALDICESRGLRGFDAVHIATAIELQEDRRVRGLPGLTFVSADREQLAAAAAEGLPVEDPSVYR